MTDAVRNPRFHAWLAPGLLALALLLSNGCYRLKSSSGGGQTAFDGARQVDPADVVLPDGYEIEVVAVGLNFPTDVAFGEGGTPYVTEAGYSYGGAPGARPRLVRITGRRSRRTVAEGDNGPWNGVAFHEGAFFVAGGHSGNGGGQVLRIEEAGGAGSEVRVDTLASGWPSYGDHHTNGLAIGPGGWLYVGQGTATNSGVVGIDNYRFGWLKERPNFHDRPCRDVRVRGRAHRTRNPLTEEDGDRARTSPFMPFGEAAEDSVRIVEGQVPCSGAVLRMRSEPVGSQLEVVAWGFRNPFGLAFAPGGTLYATDNGYDDRGSRPVWGSGDYLWKVETGAASGDEPPRWHGWPDFAGGVPISEFAAPGEEAPEPVFAEAPGEPPAPAALLGVHSSSNGLDFSTSAAAFGHAGDAFVAQFGDMAPGTGKALAPVGYRVVRIDPSTGVVTPFAANEGETNGPASKIEGNGLERPISAQFGPAGEALYVVDFGVMTTGEGGIEPRPNTGVLWRITRVNK